MMMSACRIVLIMSLVSLLLPAMLAKSQQARRRRGADECNQDTGENCPPPTPARKRRDTGCKEDPTGENCPPARKRRDADECAPSTGKNCTDRKRRDAAGCKEDPTGKNCPDRKRRDAEVCEGDDCPAKSKTRGDACPSGIYDDAGVCVVTSRKRRDTESLLPLPSCVGDENENPVENLCMPKPWKCTMGGKCFFECESRVLAPELLCDGSEDCEGGQDEENCQIYATSTACTIATTAPTTLNATCDNDIMVYLDGKLSFINKDWAEVTSVPIPAGTKVLGIACKDYGGLWGIVASTDSGMVTDDSWSCSSNYLPGWANPDFQDTHADFSLPHRGNNYVPGTNYPVPKGIARGAESIWGQDGVNSWAHCRKCLATSTACTSATTAPTTLHATCDNDIWVYLDGKLGFINMDWKEVTSITIPTGTKVLGIACHDYGGGWGIVASTDSGMVTDDSWSCSSNYVPGWANPDFQDTHGNFSSPRRGTNFVPGTDYPVPEGIARGAESIWSQGGVHAFCRKCLV